MVVSVNDISAVGERQMRLEEVGAWVKNDVEISLPLQDYTCAIYD